jgi:hypothetical protein
MSDLYNVARVLLSVLDSGENIYRHSGEHALLRAAVAQQAEPAVLWYRSGDGYAPVTFEQSHPPEPLTADEALAHGWRRFYSAPPAQQAKPVAWLVMNESGDVCHATRWRDAAHDHIIDAINNGLYCAVRWVVRPVVYAAMEGQR